MSMQIQIAARREFKSLDLWEMHKLRAKVFKDRKGWEVPVMSGMEIDGYDALDPYYMMIREPGVETLRGCWRLLPTEGPYMLKDSFAELLHGEAAPVDSRIWELSRFAIETDCDSAYKVSQITMESFAAMTEYGRKHGIERFVTVTTTSLERLVTRAGFVTERLGPPVQIGIEKAVALYIDVDATFDVLNQYRLAA
ncbi:acyl-homoserine-lactone synthase [Massilia sp. R2A-15]|uniref:acyl-homoserine-lactone synthase n=1 Tax=Massilia sp. R2A-15 TaxID=3064278 RepID=UPI0027348139|nr:acyl-homoserine-lactone synthase [Massilia sp. R2A-15]WLI91563.1 acyl-homoserine-lactone synthase [Massilia sp. R2A-15]